MAKVKDVAIQPGSRWEKMLGGTVVSAFATVMLVHGQPGVADARQQGEVDSAENLEKRTADLAWRAVGLAVGAPLVASVALMPAFHLAGPLYGSAAVGLAHASIGEPDRGLMFANCAPVAVGLGAGLGHAWDAQRPHQGDDVAIGQGNGIFLGLLGAFGPRPGTNELKGDRRGESMMTNWSWLAIAVLPVMLFAMPDETQAASNMKIVSPDERELPAKDLAAMRKAAERGTTKDWVKFGNVLRDGRTREGRKLPRDEVEALKWYRRAAEKGDALGQLAIGTMLAAGRGAALDEVEALKWLIISSTSRINWGAQAAVERLKAKLTADEQATAERGAEQWMREHPRDPLNPLLE